MKITNTKQPGHTQKEQAIFFTAHEILAVFKNA